MKRKYRKLIAFLLTAIFVAGAVPAVLANNEEWPIYLEAGEDVSVTVILRTNPNTSTSDDPTARARQQRGHALFRTHNNLVEVIDVEVQGAGTRGATVVFYRERRLYVYNAQFQFVGTTDQTLPFSSRFFLARSPINFGNTNTTTSTTTNPSTAAGQQTLPPPPAAPTASTNITPADAQRLVEQAVQAVSPGTVACIRITNPGIISYATFQELTGAARGREIAINADSLALTSNEVDVRVRLNPTLATTGLNLSASTTSPHAVAVRNLFEQYFDRQVWVVSFGQQGEFCMRVQVAAAIELPDHININDLYFYSYNSARNTFRPMEPRGLWIDANGFFHFSTDMGGDVVITTVPIINRQPPPPPQPQPQQQQTQQQETASEPEQSTQAETENAGTGLNGTEQNDTESSEQDAEFDDGSGDTSY